MSTECDRFASFLVAAALSEEKLEPDAQARAHLEACEACAARLTGLEKLVAGLHDSRPSDALWANIDAGLEAGMWLEDAASAVGDEACQACRAPVAAAELKACGECGAAHHAACWKKNAGCARQACALNPVSPAFARPSARLRRTGERPVRSRARSRVAWGLLALSLGVGSLAALRPAAEKTSGPPELVTGPAKAPSSFAFPLADLRSVDPISPYRPLVLGASSERIRRRLAATEKALSRLEALEAEVYELEGWRRRLREIQRGLSDEKGPEGGILPELHAVACRRVKVPEEVFPFQAKIRVELTRRGPPINLFLCAEEEACWELELAEGVDLQGVYLTGRGPQSITGAPEDLVVRVGDKTAPRRPPLPPFVFVPDSDGRDSLLSLTGLAPRSIIYAPELSSVVVGPESRDWRLQMVLREVEDLFGEVMRFELAEEALRTRRLAAELVPAIGALELGAGAAPRFQDLFGPLTPEKARQRGFGLLRPISYPEAPFPLGYDLCRDPKSRRLFLNTEQFLIAVDLKPGGPVVEKLPVPVSRSVAFDPERRRFLLGPQRGLPRFFDPETEQVTMLEEGENIVALDYDPGRDRYYALECDHFRAMAIRVYDGEGRALERFEAPQSFAERCVAFDWPELTDLRYFRQGLQVRARGDRLVLSLRAPVRLLHHHDLRPPRIRLFEVSDLVTKERIASGLEMDEPVRQWVAGWTMAKPR